MKNKTKHKPKPKPKCYNIVVSSADKIGVVEFQVWYNCNNQEDWDYDGSFYTLAEAEAYCRKQIELYNKDVQNKHDEPVPWKFSIYEVKASRFFDCSYKMELTIKEE